MSKKGLGKGLAALIPEHMDLNAAIEKKSDKKEAAPTGKPLLLPLSHISPNPDQPRKDFDPIALGELAESIRTYGVLQPIVVTEAKDGIYLIVAGERRFRAANMAGLKEIPAFIKEDAKETILELALIENIQREDLNGFEEALSFARLIDTFGYTQEQLAEKMGKSRPYIANALRLLSLKPAYQQLIREGKLSPGHARAVLSMSGAKEQQQLVDMILKEHISVRQAEQWAKNQKEQTKQKNEKTTAKKSKGKQDAVLLGVMKKLEEKYSTKITVEEKEKGGNLRLAFCNEEDLTRLIELLLPGECF